MTLFSKIGLATVGLSLLFLTGCTTTRSGIYSPPAAFPTRAGAPDLLPTQVQTVWVAPYIDLEGNYHSESFVYCVVRKPDWGKRPPSRNVVRLKGGARVINDTIVPIHKNTLFSSAKNSKTKVTASKANHV